MKTLIEKIVIGSGNAAKSREIIELLDGLPVLATTPEYRFTVPEEQKFSIVEAVRERLSGDSGIEVNAIDGVRVSSADGWWLLRASNTQAVLVARCESTTVDGLKRLKDALSDQLRKSGLEPPTFD